MPTFDISSHPLLSEKSKQYATGDNDQKAIFDGNVTGAELIHELYGKSYSDNELTELAKLILVYQVNFQFENDSNQDIYESVREGDTTYQYRESFGVSSHADLLRTRLEEREEEKDKFLSIRRASVGIRGDSIW